MINNIKIQTDYKIIMALNKQTILRSFNTHFFELLDEAIVSFNENENIIHTKNSLELLKKGNPSIIIKVWFKHVYTPYSEAIDGCDYNFFFTKSYVKDVDTLANTQKIIDTIDALREPIQSMDMEKKVYFMNYIQNLSKLSIAYNNL